MLSAIVLAAGLGTRLRPLTDERPKPLVFVGDRPHLAHILGMLGENGVGPIVVNTHHKPEAFHEISRWDLPIAPQMVHEPKILGTAGGIHNAGDRLGTGPVLVWNGDIVGDVSIAPMLRTFESEKAVATLAVRAGLPIGEGKVGLHRRDPTAPPQVVRLRDQRAHECEETEGAEFVGISILGPRFRAQLPSAGCLVGDGLIPAILGGEKIAAHPIEESTIDVGTLEAYLQANIAWLSARRVSSFVGSGATVSADAQLSRCVLGDGVRVTGVGPVEDVVAWPGAHVTAPLRRAVVTAHHIVALDGDIRAGF